MTNSTIEIEKFSNVYNCIKNENINEIDKVYILKKDNEALKFIKYIPKSYYRKYFMKVIYKDNNHKLIQLDPRNLNDIKVEISKVNLFLSKIN